MGVVPVNSRASPAPDTLYGKSVPSIACAVAVPHASIASRQAVPNWRACHLPLEQLDTTDSFDREGTEGSTHARPRTASATTGTTVKVDTAYWLCIGKLGEPKQSK
jgi:hypothetical protein